MWIFEALADMILELILAPLNYKKGASWGSRSFSFWSKKFLGQKSYSKTTIKKQEEPLWLRQAKEATRYAWKDRFKF